MYLAYPDTHCIVFTFTGEQTQRLKQEMKRMPGFVHINPSRPEWRFRPSDFADLRGLLQIHMASHLSVCGAHPQVVLMDHRIQDPLRDCIRGQVMDAYKDDGGLYHPASVRTLDLDLGIRKELFPSLLAADVERLNDYIAQLVEERDRLRANNG